MRLLQIKGKLKIISEHIDENLLLHGGTYPTSAILNLSLIIKIFVGLIENHSLSKERRTILRDSWRAIKLPLILWLPITNHHSVEIYNYESFSMIFYTLM